jgi:hypothetical protein
LSVTQINTITKILARREIKGASALLLLLLIVVFSYLKIGGRNITDDAAHTLQMGINLSRHGVVSMEAVPPYEPSMYREPLPAFTAAAAVMLVDNSLGAAEQEDYFAGDRARLVKLQNIFWMILLALGGFTGVWTMSRSYYTGLLGAAAVLAPIPLISAGPGALMLDSLYNDLPAAALLTSASGLLALGIRMRSQKWVVLAGMLFGGLALTKASFFYVFLVFAAILIAAGLLIRIREGKTHSLSVAVVLVAVFAITVTPWIIRNGTQLGTYAISERGGVVLHTRALKNQLTREEVRGAFYYWAPADIRPFLGRLMGLSAADAELGGSLQRLNKYKDAFGGEDVRAELEGRPGGAISYYRQARAERVRLVNELTAQGVADAEKQADKQQRTLSLQMMAEAPGQHLAMTPLFIWRGAFGITLVLLFAAWFCLANRRWDMAVYLLPAAGLTAFYALFSHFIARYSVAMTPVAIVLGVVVGQHYAMRLYAGIQQTISARASHYESLNPEPSA